ncbi:MAG: thiamine pyrophosphate-dependent enzyme [Candidatus Nanopelagicales bacterium]
MAPDVATTTPDVDAPFSVMGADGHLLVPDTTDFGEPLDVLTRRLYRDMALARRFDQEAFALQRQGELALWLLCTGQEAAQAGSIRAIRDTDFVFPSYREHTAAIARGVTVAEMLPLWRGTAQSSWSPSDYRFNIYTLVLGTQMLHAVGYAMGVRLDGSDEIVMVYVGDGAMSEGDSSEALNWAATMQAPILFMAQNNGWAISTPNAKQFKAPLHTRARGFGLDSYLVDGNDALAVHLTVREAAARVRAGGAPAFVEAITYRIGGHSTSDDPSRYRDDAELQSWIARDPIARLRRCMELEGLADDAFFDRVAAEAETLAAEIRSVCVALDPVPLSSLFRNTFVTETLALQREREEHEEFQGSFE